MTDPKQPMAEANGISTLLNQVLGLDRFPVKLLEVIPEYSKQRFPGSPVTSIKGDSLPGLEGMLRPNPARSKWLIVYDSSVTSPGRINFTIAHEFGHYMLHSRLPGQGEFKCTTEETAGWGSEKKQMENAADTFAATFLMPADDFRRHIGNNPISLDLLSDCADRYGASMQAVIRRWIDFTPERAVIVVSKDGFIKWSWSSQSALKSGAFFRSSKQTIPIPSNSLAARKDRQADERSGISLPARVWFANEPADMSVREMRIVSDYYSFVISLLILPDREPWQGNEVEDLGIETTIDRFERRGQQIVR